MTSTFDSVQDSTWSGCLDTGRQRTTFKVVLPSAVPGILSGVILAIGRIVGERATHIYTQSYATAAKEAAQAESDIEIFMPQTAFAAASCGKGLAFDLVCA